MSLEDTDMDKPLLLGIEMEKCCRGDVRFTPPPPTPPGLQRHSLPKTSAHLTSGEEKGWVGG